MSRPNAWKPCAKAVNSTHHDLGSQSRPHLGRPRRPYRDVLVQETPQLTMNTLINRRKVPPRGYLYRCPVCGFKLKNPLSSLTEVVREIRIHRRNNPSHTSLSLDFEGIVRDVEEPTCKRLPGHCHDIEAIIYEQSQTKPARKGCSTCGRGKKST